MLLKTNDIGNIYVEQIKTFECVNLKNEITLFFWWVFFVCFVFKEGKMSYLGIAKNCNSGHASYREPKASPKRPRESLPF